MELRSGLCLACQYGRILGDHASVSMTELICISLLANRNKIKSSVKQMIEIYFFIVMGHKGLSNFRDFYGYSVTDP